MLNEIIAGIAIKLNATFGDSYEIHQNNVKQGLKEPCFFIAVIKPEVTPMIGQRFIKVNPFDIQYFPENQGDNQELFTIADKLIETMDFITLQNGDQLHGTGVSYEVVDGVLHFFINYNLPMVRVPDPTYMETLEANFGTRESD